MYRRPSSSASSSPSASPVHIKELDSGPDLTPPPTPEMNGKSAFFDIYNLISSFILENMCCCCHYALNRTLLEVQIHQEPEVQVHQIRQESRFDIEETARNAKNFKGRTDREDIYTKLFNSWNQ